MELGNRRRMMNFEPVDETPERAVEISPGAWIELTEPSVDAPADASNDEDLVHFITEGWV